MPIPSDLTNRPRSFLRGSSQDHDIVISSDKVVREQAANEAATASNDDAIPHLPVQLESNLPCVAKPFRGWFVITSRVPEA
jgi:hypothetical protein